MTLYFTKMHGLGNDFIVIDAIRQSVNLTRARIAMLSKRDTGIGFDQCLLIEASRAADCDFFYRIFNADGQEVGQCGNGARCLARFVHYYQLTDKKAITVATKTTRMQLHINPDDTVTVNMGKPQLLPEKIPLNRMALQPVYSLPLDNESTCEFHAINVGNPHAVLITDHIAEAPVTDLGRFICEHPLFPEQTNVGFMQIQNAESIALRVYERGCGETRACGSGAVAAAAVGRLYHGLGETVKVDLPGGSLLVFWPDVQKDIFLTGPAAFVYEGKILC
ncbi:MULTISPECIES: diaminopimelate epimerase [Legionella]|uniref:Diaminopimelate epimerase n=1 Tax=Legionella septentrionalis TaxID=2498109 RepID=A0A433JIS7_9GAMM|nr:MULTISPECIES: diaminopimelate epimerase [Legionella]MCP0913848.1 diaminopimelate epimerase [Legionella sp. 27cVA30]RUQ85281.1 diaminopimelate epimerase [Legionella septentrionalis]RUQ98695.1 diaminopimelate epimerase [Legionella septentrionalis]RUR09933.1 diaminopimelate epimerase [Legionella septentrionalis]RUR14988.1 diaminopimelate epimerase [Legionella septentrionalis]